MPDGRTEIESIKLEVEHTVYEKYTEPSTHSIYLYCDLTESDNRNNLIDKLQSFKSTFEKIICGEYDLSKPEWLIENTDIDYSNNYKMVKVNNYVFYP